MATSRLRKGAIGLSLAGLLAVSTIGVFEGLRLYSYPDIIGVWTACYGETNGIRPGMRFTKQQCDTMFTDRLVEFETGMRKCLTKPDTIPDKPYVAFLSLSYNIGTGAFCRSTLVRKANAGDIRGACNELPKWNRAGGQVVAGLTNRRLNEQRLCLDGLPS